MRDRDHGCTGSDSEAGGRRRRPYRPQGFGDLSRPSRIRRADAGARVRKGSENSRFLIDREAEGKAGEDYVSFLGSDFIKQGQRVADWLYSTHRRTCLNRRTGGNRGIARDRSQGFASHIKTKRTMRIIASQNADFSRATRPVQCHNRQTMGREARVSARKVNAP
ncbi:MAG: periplasmic binding protein/LacI transcriptional regulator [Bryobacterales bacterium]|nr:periplasmic binding protein/LacI transcriptional regulator [Bryobacterales bacterium]